MALAARGARNLDSGVEKVDDAGEAAAAKRKAMVVLLKATVLAAGVTALTFLF